MYGSEGGYQRYLNEIGASEEQLRERIIRSRRLEGITGREVYQKVKIDQNDVDKLYLEYKKAGKLRKDDEFYVKEILLMTGKDDFATRKTAESLLTRVKQDNNEFGRLILDGTFIVRNLRVTKEKYPVIYERMEKMEIGQLSDVVEDDGQLHIFKVLQKDKARDLTEEEAKGMLEDRLAPYAQEKRRQEWMKELRKGAEIEIFLDDQK